MNVNDEMKCYICNKEGDLRPYGLNGAPICFPCMKASSERESEAKRQFEGQFNKAAAHTGAAMIGTSVGPVPVILPKGNKE